MMKNADSIMKLIEDPTGRARKAQVGVDLTLNRVSRVGYSLNMLNGGMSPFGSAGVVASDESPKDLAKLAKYLELKPRQIEGHVHGVFELDVGVYSIEMEQGLKPLPDNNSAFIINRSTVGRSGAVIRSSVYDPGFTTSHIGALLYVLTPICIEQYARVAQIILMENETAELYNGSYQGSKDIR